MANWNQNFIDTVRALYAGQQPSDVDTIDVSELPPATVSLTFAAYVDGVLQNVTLEGTTDEIEVEANGTAVTVKLADTYFLKGVTDAAGLRTKAGLGTIATKNVIAASADSAADTATAPGAAYVQAEVAAILTELRALKAEFRDFKTKARAVQVLAT